VRALEVKGSGDRAKEEALFLILRRREKRGLISGASSSSQGEGISRFDEGERRLSQWKGKLWVSKSSLGLGTGGDKKKGVPCWSGKS